jgi:hypothetical protein
MCLDHRRIIEYSFTVYPHQAIPPIHSSSPTPSHPLMCASSQCQQIHLRPRVAHTHMCRVYSSPSGAPTRNHSIFLTTRKQRIRRRHTCTGSRGVESLDTERGRARSLLRVLTRSRSFVDALECRELDYDGCGHGWRQLSGSYHHSFRHCCPLLPDHILIKSVGWFSRYVPNKDIRGNAQRPNDYRRGGVTQV